MKKIICLLLAAMLVMMSACTDTNEETAGNTEGKITESAVPETAVDNGDGTTEPAGDTSEEQSADTDAPEAQTREITVSVETMNFPVQAQAQVVRADYPVLSGTVNDELANRLLKDKITQITEKTVGDMLDYLEPYSYGFDIEEIGFVSENFISLYCIYYHEAFMARQYFYSVTINLDITEGKFLEMEDICSDFEEFTKLLVEGDTFTIIFEGDDDMKAELDAQGRDTEINNFTMPYVIGEGSDLYLAISVSVPAVMGNHAEYKAKFSDVEHLLTDDIITLTKGTK